MARTLLSYCQAIEVIRSIARPLGRKTVVDLYEAAGYAIAESAVSGEPNPRFDNSAIDGYAVGFAADAEVGSKLTVPGTSWVNLKYPKAIQLGQAIRIFTGAPIPQGTFGLIMQEDVEAGDGWIVVKENVKEGEFIRRQGAEFASGTQLAPIGAVVDAGVAAQLAFVGTTIPAVFEPPRVAVITTGYELVDPAQKPKNAGIRDTNSVMLSLQVEDAVPSRPRTMRLPDDRSLLMENLSALATQNDVILISGGASVGDLDHTGGIVEELGTVHFHGVSIRPGKPTLFGSIGSCLVFGLPGNPASSFVCFELFVREALQRLAGWGDCEPRWIEAVAGFDHENCGREDFVRVRIEDGVIVSAGEQGSFGIGSLARAHGLARFPGDRNTEAGERVQVCWLK
jgi:molybdopterin molybdotransferase